MTACIVDRRTRWRGRLCGFRPVSRKPPPPRQPRARILRMAGPHTLQGLTRGRGREAVPGRTCYCAAREAPISCSLFFALSFIRRLASSATFLHPASFGNLSIFANAGHPRFFTSSSCFSCLAESWGTCGKAQPEARQTATAAVMDAPRCFTCSSRSLLWEQGLSKGRFNPNVFYPFLKNKGMLG